MFWKLIARIIANPLIADRIIDWAMRTPDEHLEGYMERFWLFNAYDRITRVAKYRFFKRHIRVHHILREDYGRHHHDHPWDARTIILRGGYVERRRLSNGVEIMHTRRPGDTATLNFGEYHTVSEMLDVKEGAWTLFIMSGFKGDWGFMVNGENINHKDYLKSH